MVGDCLQGQLSRHLLGESIPVGEINFVNLWSASGWPKKQRRRRRVWVPLSTPYLESIYRIKSVPVRLKLLHSNGSLSFSK